MDIRRWIAGGVMLMFIGACAVGGGSGADDDDDDNGSGPGSGGSGAMGGASGVTSSGQGGAGVTSSSSTSSSSSASVSSSSGGSACDTGVLSTIESQLCTDCVNCATMSVCAAELNICNNSPDCILFAGCLDTCAAGDTVCIDGCVAQYPTGSQQYLDVLSCAVCQACPANCDAATNCS